MKNKVDVVSEIFKKHDAFSDVELKIAQFVSENPRLVAISSISKLSKMIGVSTASVSRFAKVIGLESIRDLKFHLAQSFNTVELPAVDQRLASSGYNLIYESLSTILLNNVTTLSGSHITILCDFIAEAEKVYIFGSEPTSQHCAEDACYRLTQLGKVTLTASSPDLIMAHTRNITPNDLIISLDISQQPEFLIDVTSRAKQTGCRAAAITTQLSELTNLADMVFAINTQEINDKFRTSALRHLLITYIDAIELELTNRQLICV